MDLVADEALRQHGWRVFRSSWRDRVIPMTGQGAKLQRVKIGEAYPVEGVVEGAAVPIEARGVELVTKSASLERLERLAIGQALGLSKVLYTQIVSVTGNPDPVNSQEETWEIGIAPFDGFITEININQQSVGTGQAFAIRTSAGQTMFQSSQFTTPSPFLTGVEPDLARGHLVSIFQEPLILRHLRLPIYSGDRIIIAIEEPPFFAAGTAMLEGSLVMEAFVSGSLSAAATASMFRAATSQSARASADAANMNARLKIEQEKTRRIQVQNEADLAKIRAIAGARQALARAAPPAAPPRVPTPPRTPLEGEGKTFVSAWNPSFGYIGYLIPDPPRGGRVNVFDNKYSVFDITGKLTEQGPIIPVASDQDIPPGARLSAVTKGVLSPAQIQDNARRVAGLF